MENASFETAHKVKLLLAYEPLFKLLLPPKAGQTFLFNVHTLQSYPSASRGGPYLDQATATEIASTLLTSRSQ